MSVDERQQRIDDVKARLRRALDDLDEQTRLPGEPPLREAVAAQARQRLAKESA